MIANTDELPFEGIVTALLTPFKNGEVDEASLSEHVKTQLENGVHNLFVCGTMGEGPLMDPEHRKNVVELTISIVQHEIPVIAHIGSIDTKTAVSLAQHAERAGADAVSSITPYYFPHDEQSYINYYKSISQAVDLPILIYNNPGLTNCNLMPQTVKEIADHCPNVQGIKDSSRSLSQIGELIDIFDGDFNVLVGGSWLLVPALATGADGCVSSISNIIPDIEVELFRKFKAGKLKDCRELSRRIIAIRRLLQGRPYISTHKELVKLAQGYSLGEVLEPLRALKIDEKETLAKKFQNLGWI